MAALNTLGIIFTLSSLWMTASNPNVDPHQHVRGPMNRSGMTGEFFRYVNLMGDSQPSMENQSKSLKLADDIRCDVCETILRHMIKKINPITEDSVDDAIEGMTDNEHEYTYKNSDGSQQSQVDWHKRGCNKHFKDEFVALGYHVVPCKDNPQRGCVKRDKENLPNKHSIETYEIWKEAVFYACEQTVATYADEFRKAIVKHGMGAIQFACREEANCAVKKSTFKGSEL